jgi:hypothetical protein
METLLTNAAALCGPAYCNKLIAMPAALFLIIVS